MNSEQSNVSGNLFLYKQVDVLSPQRHQNFGVTAVQKPFGFASAAHMVPITISEFPAVTCNYPILFSVDDHMPFAALGLQENQNCFVDQNGQWKTDHYIPAYIRRYPFVLVKNKEDQNLTLCFDQASEYICKNKPDIAFFENDEATDYVNQAMQTCQNYEQDMQTTQEMITRLRTYDLLENKTSRFAMPGQDADMPKREETVSYLGFDTEKFDAMSDQNHNQFRKDGLLHILYGALFSQANWNRIASVHFAG